MTDRDVDAALARVEDWEAMYVLDSLDVQAARTLRAALAEARQQLAAQAQQLTWAKVVASQLVTAERLAARLAQQLASQSQEIVKLRGALAADEERLRAAADRAGVAYTGCDTPDALAEAVEAQRERDAQVCRDAMTGEPGAFNRGCIACAAAIRAARSEP